MIALLVRKENISGYDDRPRNADKLFIAFLMPVEAWCIKEGTEFMSKPTILGLAVALVTAIAMLSGIVLCEVTSIRDTAITAEVTPYISITPPDMSARWIINPSILNAITKDLIVNANADWKVGAKAPNGANMKATGTNGINHTLVNYMQISTTNVSPFKPSTTTNNYFLRKTIHGSNLRFPITFHQQGSFDDIIQENDTPLDYSVVVTFTGMLE